VTRPLYIAFIWHMHQPYYRDLSTGIFSLPWVRLHGTKDYLHMLDVLGDYPVVHVTFNLVPCLIEQLDTYARGHAVDPCLELSRRAHWSAEERHFMLSFFFHANGDRIIQKYPEYARLWQLRQAAPDHPELFSEQFYRDLACWFNLAWIDPNWLEKDSELSALVNKASNFTQSDCTRILDKQDEILRRILPTYRQMAQSGQIELSTSPYYHPIIPLLMDSAAARRASPGLPLPEPAFAHPEDADEQIRLAVEAHRKHFGASAVGIWPSEGAVCQEMIGVLARNGFRWLASDESILARSLGIRIERDSHAHTLDPTILYQPYYASGTPGAPAIVFRDHVLSDRIGFGYQHMDGNDAADDLLYRLYLTRDKLLHFDEPYLVTIILDGENCWEAYEHNGDKFLRRLYSRLAQERDYLQTVTVSEYLDRFPVRKKVDHLATGSWIAGNLETWIGEPAQNAAWEALERVRDELVARLAESSLPDVATLERAWKAVYVAEGSDWFWWYYSRNNPTVDDVFDRNFRRHLEQVYISLGLPTPGWLKTPIEVTAELRVHWQMPVRQIAPRLSAEEHAPDDWVWAGFIDPTPAGGAMQRAETGLRRLYFGSNDTHLFLRLESDRDMATWVTSVYLSLLNEGTSNRRPRLYETNPSLELPALGLDWELRISRSEATLYHASGQEGWTGTETPLEVARGPRVREAAIPYAALGALPDTTLGLLTVVYENGQAVEALPTSGYLRFSPVTQHKGKAHVLPHLP
jgi:alpha-amylase/alpha-mannosidase (GH57 family)